jgi:hypothetical protein
MSEHEMQHGGRFHMDDRGIRYCDIFPEIGKGDINVSIIEPGAAALWHRHMHQDDYQIVIKGSLKVGKENGRKTPATYIGIICLKELQQMVLFLFLVIFGMDVIIIPMSKLFFFIILQISMMEKMKID